MAAIRNNDEIPASRHVTYLQLLDAVLHSLVFLSFFLFLWEQFIEPCKQLEWDSNETEIFLGSLVDTCSKLDSLYKYVLFLNHGRQCHHIRRQRGPLVKAPDLKL